MTVNYKTPLQRIKLRLHANDDHRSRLKKIIGRKIVNIFLSISFSICFGCSKEPSHRDGSFEYPKHMFWKRNKEINS